MWASGFKVPVLRRISPDNHWITMVTLIPWSEFQEEYGNLFSGERGAPALSGRIGGINY